MRKQNILVLGGSGFIGERLCSILRNESQVSSTSLNSSKNFLKLNILDRDVMEKIFEKTRPEIVINLTAVYNNLEFCENNKDITMKINGEALKNISKLVNKFDSYLVQMSSDYVFDGKKGNYNEGDLTNPINFYGKSKLEGEENVLNLCKKFCIIRTSMVYDKSNLKKTLPVWIIEKILRGEEIGLIDDQIMTPTYRENLCQMMNEVIQKKYEGIIHLAGNNKTSRYQFARILLSLFKLDNSRIFPEKRKNFSFGQQMPEDSSLNIDKAKNLLNNKPESLETSLKKFFEKYYHG